MSGKLSRFALTVLWSTLLIDSAVAGSMGAQPMMNPTASFFTYLKSGHFSPQLGFVDVSQGQAQHINMQTLIGDDFTVTNKHDQNVLLGLAYLIDGADHGQFHLSYGVDIFYLPKTTVHGNVVQEQLYTNLSYQYGVSHVPIYALAKTDVGFNDSLSFTADVGIGPNIMQTSHFSEASLDGITVPDRIFSGKTNVAFSATAGVGVKINHVFGSSLPLECGYRFFYLGQGHFNVVNTQVLNALRTGSGYANALVFSVAL